jgi:hypothetical protein
MTGRRAGRSLYLSIPRPVCFSVFAVPTRHRGSTPPVIREIERAWEAEGTISLAADAVPDGPNRRMVVRASRICMGEPRFAAAGSQLCLFTGPKATWSEGTSMIHLQRGGRHEA